MKEFFVLAEIEGVPDVQWGRLTGLNHPHEAKTIIPSQEERGCRS
jgi:hypothetical protein